MAVDGSDDFYTHMTEDGEVFFISEHSLKMEEGYKDSNPEEIIIDK